MRAHDGDALPKGELVATLQHNQNADNLGGYT